MKKREMILPGALLRIGLCGEGSTALAGEHAPSAVPATTRQKRPQLAGSMKARVSGSHGRRSDEIQKPWTNEQ